MPSYSKLRIWVFWGSLAAFVVFLYLVRSVMAPFLVALLLMYLLNPLVNRLTQWKPGGRTLPRVVVVSVLLVTLLLALIGLLSWIIPALAQEFKPFRQNLPVYYQQIVQTHLPNLITWLQGTADRAGLELNIQESLMHAGSEALGSEGGISIVDEARKLVGGVFSALFSSILVFILTLFLLSDWPSIRTMLAEMVPRSLRSMLGELVEALDRDLSGSIRGQLSICLINFVLTTIGLFLLDVKYALTLGVVAGMFSIIPVFGSIMSTVPIVLVALTTSVLDAVKAMSMIALIHLIEANFLNPKVMGHHVELHPVVILFAIMVGEHFLGPIGLLVGVPVMASARSILRFAYQRWVLAEAPEDGESNESSHSGTAHVRVAPAAD